MFLGCSTCCGGGVCRCSTGACSDYSILYGSQATPTDTSGTITNPPPAGSSTITFRNVNIPGSCFLYDDGCYYEANVVAFDEGRGIAYGYWAYYLRYFPDGSQARHPTLPDATGYMYAQFRNRVPTHPQGPFYSLNGFDATFSFPLCSIASGSIFVLLHHLVNGYSTGVTISLGNPLP